MPRVAGVNLMAVLAAAIAMYFVGALVYGVLFAVLWQGELLEDRGLIPGGQAAMMSADEISAAMEPLLASVSPIESFGFGFLIALATALGLAIALNLMKPASLVLALIHGGILWIGFAATTLACNPVYSLESPTIYGVDLLHLLFSYLLGSAIIYLIDGKALRGLALSRQTPLSQGPA